MPLKRKRLQVLRRSCAANRGLSTASQRLGKGKPAAVAGFEGHSVRRNLTKSIASDELATRLLRLAVTKSIAKDPARDRSPYPFERCWTLSSTLPESTGKTWCMTAIFLAGSAAFLRDGSRLAATGCPAA